jgi:hypothetical protein
MEGTAEEEGGQNTGWQVQCPDFALSLPAPGFSIFRLSPEALLQRSLGFISITTYVRSLMINV